ncbi:glycosyltransferase family 2 protein [Holdemanella biformis]|uniref:glycosyltransferase family 2 protein n=2 Tax=Holdemanella biformis TaxID=1735 RepID=UPI0022E9493B|nr:glycosyltransferase [Holdemanella biformis]
MSVTKTPLVSVIMSTYNDEEFINESISSILNQTYNNFEFIIINDASNDDTKRILDNLLDDRLIIIHNKKNQKLAKNLNKAISISKGKYIARMDADDISLINRMSIQVDFMERNPDVDVVGSFAEKIGDQSGIISYPLKHEEIKDKLLFDNCMCHPSIMFRKSTLDYTYDENCEAAQDYELWSRIIWDKKFANIPKPLLKYRIHSNQTRNKNGNNQKKGAKIARIQMIAHLMEIDENIYVYINKAFDYLTPKSHNELKCIENVLLSIKKCNEKKNVFTNGINKLIDKQFFYNWYISVGCDNIWIGDLKKSSLGYSYKKFSINTFFKIIYRIILNRRLSKIAKN